MTLPGAESAMLSVRMRGIPEIVDGDWVLLTQGITVLTGRNNVGKTRVLQAIAGLHPDAPWSALLPEARIESGDTVIELETGRQGALERYEVTGPTGTTTGAWVPDPNNPGYSILRFSDGSPGVSTPDRQRWNSWSLPSKELAEATLRRLTFVPAQRTIPGTVTARRVEVPGPSGPDLGMAIFTRRNDDAPEFHELQRVMAELFPEIDAILTQAVGDQSLVQITYRDRFAGRSTPLEQSGTGVAQALHLIALTLFSEPGRILLIDEPHAYLHPGAERRLVQFLRDHPEHAYVCATHSPVFINAADPEACWLVTRDQHGTAMHSVFAEGFTRRHIFSELGIDPGDVALAERILFVEGPSDQAAYPLLLARLGYDTARQNCLVLSLAGADLTRPLSAVLTELSAQLHVPFTVLLDGDKQDQYRDNRNVCFLPVADLEELFLQDPQAVHDGLLFALAEEDPEGAKAVEAQWSPDAVATYLAQHRHPRTKAAELLTGLARQMGTTYRKPVHAPLIAACLSDPIIEQLRPIVMPRLDPQEASTEQDAADPDASAPVRHGDET
ncbi:MAG TPA: AAA family ATPase [Streptosporangiaceae bacterium]|nr:AAA family ATPase [Streptosporangiaceae bacterium]